MPSQEAVQVVANKYEQTDVADEGESLIDLDAVDGGESSPSRGEPTTDKFKNEETRGTDTELFKVNRPGEGADEDLITLDVHQQMSDDVAHLPDPDDVMTKADNEFIDDLLNRLTEDLNAAPGRQ